MPHSTTRELTVAERADAIVASQERTALVKATHDARNKRELVAHRSHIEAKERGLRMARARVAHNTHVTDKVAGKQASVRLRERRDRASHFADAKRRGLAVQRVTAAADALGAALADYRTTIPDSSLTSAFLEVPIETIINEFVAERRTPTRFAAIDE